MLCNSAAPSLVVISFRIASEPNFVQELRRQVEARKLDSGEVICEEEAAALLSFLDQETPIPVSYADWSSGDVGNLDTWVG